MNETHEMVLKQEGKNGLELWICPTCDRRFLLRWEPFQRTILIPGDEYVTHAGGKGGLRLSSVEVEEL